MASVTPAARQDPTQLRPAPGKVSRLRWLGTRGRDAVRPTTAVELESMTSGGDAVPEGFVRFSVGAEDPEDLVADLVRALDESAD